MYDCHHDIQLRVRQFPGAPLCLFLLACAVLWVAPAAAQQLTENAAAAGVSGQIQAIKGQEVPIYSVQLFDANGGAPPFVQLGSVANAGIQLTLNDLNAATGFSAADITELRLYRSTDAVLGGGDALVTTQAVVANAVTIDATVAAVPANRLVPTFPGIYFIVTAVISQNATNGHAFTVGALINHVGATETPPAIPTTAGSPVLASDANHVAIGRPAQPVIGGTLAIPFGGESAMLCLLLGSGVFVLWRRA